MCTPFEDTLLLKPRQHTEEAVETLATIMRRGRTEAARVRATEALLARGWGQPGHLADIGADKGPLKIIVSYVDRSDSTEEAE